MRTTHRPFTTLALALSLFVAALEMTVVSTAMPTVVSDLGGIQHYAWVFTAYMLSSTITVPIYGKLADLYGRKPILLFGSTLFLLASVACGFSTSMNMLIAFRVLQGLGAGAMQPIAITIIGDIYTLEQRGKVQGAFSAVWGIAGLAGPLTGGLIVKYLTWHWIFFINIPIGIASMVLLVAFFHEQLKPKVRVRLDYAGAALLSSGVVALLFGVQGSGRTLLALPLAAVLLTAFVFVELRAAEPIIPMSIFKIPTIAISNVAGALFSAAQFGATTYVPLYVQGVLGGSATMAGGMITPMIVGWPLASLIGGRLMVRTGFRPLIVGGLGLASIGTVLMALLLKPGASMLVPQIAMGLFGIGLGFAAMATMVAVQTTVGWELRGVATASSMFFRTIGGSLGVGVMGGVLVSQLMKDPTVPVSAATELLGPEHGRGLAPAVLDTLGGALNTGLSINFWIMCSAMIAAFAAGLFFPKVKRVTTPVDMSDVTASH
ncbi:MULTISPECIES: MDR family MFS transporter [unclassified Corallococcus]|uniref:MDR family MFS transporter n=1 Tax=unclassified Corallococcus TaxID=2685029 RepID=UPI001A8E89F1|nr:MULTISPECIES: MDR family MFS transporter [unclassified Corallococcus]MBN9684221.1 MFS transporter [Corallococcus sp. NCSPR001]WAS84292.1 MDR family MFS transporter [Corallococcus sp. NCRR]